MLDLCDPSWSQLKSRDGCGDKLASVLNRLPVRDDEYYRLLYQCCDLDDGNVYPVAYAIMPHLVHFGIHATDASHLQWPLFISAAICSSYKTTKNREDVPDELWDAFFAASHQAAEQIPRLVEGLPDTDPAAMKAMMIGPVFNLETKPLFGAPVPRSFVLYDWFESHRPQPNGG